MQAVKNAFRFVQWQVARFSLFGWLCFSSMFCTFLSIITNGRASDVFMIASLALLIGMFGMLVSSVLKTQYSKFKEERQTLFDTIKYSDKQN